MCKMQHAQFCTYETLSINNVNYSIRSHCLLVCSCFTRQPIHQLAHMQCDPPPPKKRYKNISPLMQPTYTGGHSKFQFLADRHKHLIPVPNVDYIITAQCIIMNACSVQALLEYTLSLKKIQH
jgi:hypothetical protein